MNKAVSLPRGSFGRRGNQVFTGMKAIVLVAAAWGLVYPALLWSLEHLLQQA